MMPGLAEWFLHHNDRHDRVCDSRGQSFFEYWRSKTHRQHRNFNGGMYAKGRDACKRRRMEARRACREERRPCVVPMSERETMEDALAAYFYAAADYY